MKNLVLQATLVLTMLLALPTLASAPSAATVNITIAANGQIYSNGSLIPDSKSLYAILETAGAREPQPEAHLVHSGNYETVGKVIYQLNRAGFKKIRLESPDGVHLVGYD